MRRPQAEFHRGAMERRVFSRDEGSRRWEKPAANLIETRSLYLQGGSKPLSSNQLARPAGTPSAAGPGRTPGWGSIIV